MGDERRITQLLAEIDQLQDTDRRITQLLAEVDQIQDTDRRITQVLAEADQDATEERRATQLVLEVDFLEGVAPVRARLPSHDQSRALTVSIWQPDIAWTAPASLASVVWTPEGQHVESFTEQIETYKQTLRALGGYWEARFRINMGREQIEQWLEERLGWHVEVYDEAQLTIFEGFVNRMDAAIGGFAVTRGPLVQSANRVSVVYSLVDTATTPPTFGVRTTTTVAEDAAPQQRYGIIQRVLSAGGCATAAADQVRDTWLAENSRPRTTKRWTNVPAGRSSLTVTVYGYVRLMECYVYEYTGATDTEALETKLARVLDQDPNALLSSANASIVSAASINVTRYDHKQRTAWAVTKDLVARGDGNDDRYIFGVWANRRSVYALAPDVPEYHTRMSDAAQRVETPTGIRVYPWNVLPGKWMLVTDFLVGRVPPMADPRQDPRALFIEQATYTAPWTLALQAGRVDRADQMLAQRGLSGLGG